MESHADLSGSEFNRTVSKSSLNAQVQCLSKASVKMWVHFEEKKKLMRWTAEWGISVRASAWGTRKYSQDKGERTKEWHTDIMGNGIG